MRLSTLLQAILPEIPVFDCEVGRLVSDSRLVKPGDVFIALQGAGADGRLYIDTALSKGASAVLVEGGVNSANPAVISIPDLRHRLGRIAAVFYGEPAREMHIIGVTGTNGKTSCTHFLAQALESEGIKTGIIGTLGSGLYGALREAGLTTPEPIALQALLADLRAQHAAAVAMEVSSHSIDQGRVNDIAFDIGIFTNLSRDHLDYHGDMASYAAVKYRFLSDMPVKHVVLNIDDVYSRQWLKDLEQRKSLFLYGIGKPQEVPGSLPCVYAESAQFSLNGIQAQLVTPWGEGQLELPLIGQFNLSNALAVLAALCIGGMPLERALASLSGLSPVPGRMQRLGGGGKPLVVVDYAHTPDALQNALRALREHTRGKLICAFGCGGDRDAGKRPLMAKIAEELSDLVIVTNDNPRHEVPESIADQIFRGFREPEHVYRELDRSKAIQKSIQLASVDDCILIAGKGAERYQQIGDKKLPFDDVEAVRSYL